MNKLVKVAICVFTLIIILTFVLTNSSRTYQLITEQPLESETANDNSLTQESTSEVQTIYVEITGAVSRPGVYEYAPGVRVEQLFIDAEVNGNTNCFNLAAKLVDEQKFLIPDKGQKCPQQSAIDNLGVVNINTASALELTTISGIGEAKAQNIVDYRDSHGSFQTEEDLLNVEGISESLLTEISPSIRLS